MKYLFGLIVILFSTVATFANPSEFRIAKTYASPKKSQSGFDRTKLLLGPGIGIGAYSRAFSFNIDPSIGYALTPNFSVGAGLGFNYSQQSIDYNNGNTGQAEIYRRKIPAYSASLFARYMIANMIIIGIQPELNNTKYITGNATYQANGKISEPSSRLTVPSFLAGAGYGQRYGAGYYYFMGMYDLVQNPNAWQYYQTIAIKVGIMLPLFNH